MNGDEVNKVKHLFSFGNRIISSTLQNKELLIKY